MKRTLFKLFTITVLLSSLFTIKSNAQEIKLGGGLIIGTDIPPLGLQFKGSYGMNMVLENLSGSLEFAIYFPSSKTNYDHSKWLFDIDGNYTVWNISDFDFYAIGGLNITHYEKKYTGSLVNVGDIIDTKLGLNVGAGANYGFSSNLSAFCEVKYILSNFNQSVLNFGVLFEL